MTVCFSPRREETPGVSCNLPLRNQISSACLSAAGHGGEGCYQTGVGLDRLLPEPPRHGSPSYRVSPEPSRPWGPHSRPRGQSALLLPASRVSPCPLRLVGLGSLPARCF